MVKCFYFNHNNKVCQGNYVDGEKRLVSWGTKGQLSLAWTIVRL